MEALDSPQTASVVAATDAPSLTYARDARALVADGDVAGVILALMPDYAVGYALGDTKVTVAIVGRSLLIVTDEPHECGKEVPCNRLRGVKLTWWVCESEERARDLAQSADADIRNQAMLRQLTDQLLAGGGTFPTVI